MCWYCLVTPVTFVGSSSGDGGGGGTGGPSQEHGGRHGDDKDP